METPFVAFVKGEKILATLRWIFILICPERWCLLLKTIDETMKLDPGSVCYGFLCWFWINVGFVKIDTGSRLEGHLDIGFLPSHHRISMRSQWSDFYPPFLSVQCALFVSVFLNSEVQKLGTFRWSLLSPAVMWHVRNELEQADFSSQGFLNDSRRLHMRTCELSISNSSTKAKNTCWKCTSTYLPWN